MFCISVNVFLSIIINYAVVLLLLLLPKTALLSIAVLRELRTYPVTVIRRTKCNKQVIKCYDTISPNNKCMEYSTLVHSFGLRTLHNDLLRRINFQRAFVYP
jgi:hypothetical protein